MARMIKREFMMAIVLPEHIFIGKKGEKWIYKSRWTEEYYHIYKHGDGYIVETWIGGCHTC
ncbi:MAG: hypothetical protein K6T73_01240 [Candidatus Bathyarchaeota archaeon]|nr:hypothetical protein [Candidatus Bathyarchaeota archaeon]